MSPVDTHGEILAALGLRADQYDPLLDTTQQRFLILADRYAISA
jgi:hypothetical protein